MTQNQIKLLYINYSKRDLLVVETTLRQHIDIFNETTSEYVNMLKGIIREKKLEQLLK
jgi:hypothetical protein